MPTSRLSMRFSRFLRDRRGSIATMAAVTLPVLIGAAALAVDLGSLYQDRRAKQGFVDLAAMAAASDLDRAAQLASESLAANGVTDLSRLTVTKGNYVADPNVAASARFKPNQAPFNAVQVGLTTKSPLFFARLFAGENMDVGVQAMAMPSAQAMISAGSRLAAVRDGVVNSLLGALLGSNVELSVADYNALVNSNIQLLDFLNALSTQLNVTAGTYNDVLNTNATFGDILSAAISVAETNGDTALALALKGVRENTSKASLTVPLNQLVNLGPYGQAEAGSVQNGLGATLTAMELLTTSGVLANEDHQLALDLGATIPGLASVTLTVTVGERPQQTSWASVGTPGAEVSTSQIRLHLEASVLGSGALGGTLIRLPIDVSVANGRARLTSVVCKGTDASGNVATVEALPGVVDARIGQWMPGSGPWSHGTIQPVTLVDLGLVRLRGKAHIAMESENPTTLSFTQSDVDSGTIKRTETRNYLNSVVSSLLGDLDLDVQVLGFSLLPLDLLKSTLKTTLSSVAKPLDGVLASVLNALGVHLGELDVKVHGTRCSGGVLAQ